MGDLYLTGGEQRSSVFLPNAEWHGAKKAVVLRVDPDTSKVIDRIEYLSPGNTCPNDNPAIAFTAATPCRNRLCTCPGAEVIVFELPGFRRLTYISLPCFYLHHVLPTPSGILIVVVTGLDMVVLVDSHSLIS